MYVCVCNAVNDRQVREALEEGWNSLSSLRQRLGYNSSCGRCTGCLRKMIETHQSVSGLQGECANCPSEPEALCG
jgi:bacterioferritin-associated ferredoxin